MNMCINGTTLLRLIVGVIASAALASSSADTALAATGDYTVAFCGNPDTGMGVGAADAVVPQGFNANIQHTVGPAPADIQCGPGSMSASRGVLLRPNVPFTTNI